MSERVSELFEDVVTDGNGTTSISCDFCGRLTFTSMDEEAEKWREKQKAEPEKYIESGDDGLGFGWLDGKQYVYGCCPEKILRYEEFIWRHRTLIMKYLKRRTQQNLEAAARDAALCEPS